LHALFVMDSSRFTDLLREDILLWTPPSSLFSPTVDHPSA